MSKVIDASAIIRAWEYYPQRQFPGFWRWVAAELKAQRWVMSRANVEEVKHKVSELHKWLTTHGLHTVEVSNDIAKMVNVFKGLLGIVDDRYAGRGVDEPDLIPIATCACLGYASVNCEAEQLDSKQELRNSRIPRVCRLDGVRVDYMDLTKCVSASKVVFDDFERS